MGTVSSVISGSGERRGSRRERDAVATSISRGRRRERAGLEFERTGFAEARGELEPFEAEDSGFALNLLRAFTGALGPEEQSRAFAGFEESPGVAFLREQGTRTGNRAAATVGGLGGGTRLKALTEFSQGLALQDLERQLGDLRDIAGVDLGLAKSFAELQLGLRGAEAASSRRVGNLETGGALKIGALAGESARRTGANKASIFESALSDISGTTGLAFGIGEP